MNIFKFDLILDNFLKKNEDTIKFIIPDWLDNIFVKYTYYVPIFLATLMNPGYTIYFAPLLVTTIVLKWIFGRLHPGQADGKDTWNYFTTKFGNPEYQAMPSGHVFISLFAALTCLNSYAAWIWFALTSIIMFFRRHHWISDIIVGIFLASCLWLISLIYGPFYIKI